MALAAPLARKSPPSIDKKLIFFLSNVSGQRRERRVKPLAGRLRLATLFFGNY